MTERKRRKRQSVHGNDKIPENRSTHILAIAAAFRDDPGLTDIRTAIADAKAIQHIVLQHLNRVCAECQGVYRCDCGTELHDFDAKTLDLAIRANEILGRQIDRFERVHGIDKVQLGELLEAMYLSLAGALNLAYTRGASNKPIAAARTDGVRSFIEATLEYLRDTRLTPPGMTGYALEDGIPDARAITSAANGRLSHARVTEMRKADERSGASPLSGQGADQIEVDIPSAAPPAPGPEPGQDLDTEVAEGDGTEDDGR